MVLRMGGGMNFKKIYISGVLPEEWTTGGENNLVSLNLVVLTRQGNIEEIFIISEFSKGNANVRLEIVPTQTKLLTRTHLWIWISSHDKQS